MPSKTIKSEIKTEALENSLRVINYCASEDEAVIRELLRLQLDIRKTYTDPFSKELNKNLLNIESYQGKSDLIKYYIFELSGLSYFFDDYRKIFTTGKLTHDLNIPYFYSYIGDDGNKRDLDEDELYAVRARDL